MPTVLRNVLYGWLPRCMSSANKFPLCLSGCDALDIRWVVLVPGLTGLPSQSHRARNLVKLISSSAKPFVVVYAASAGRWPVRKISPRTMIAQMIRVVLFAIATVATLVGFRASRSARRGSIVAGLYFARRTSEVVPTMSSLRRYLSPILVIRPKRSLPDAPAMKRIHPTLMSG